MRKRSASRSTSKTILRLFDACLILGFAWVIANNLVIARLKGPLPVLTPQMTYAAAALNRPATPINWPAFGQAAIGIGGYGVLATNGSQTAVPTASVAKLITALAVLKVKPIDPGSQGAMLTLSAKDVAFYNKYAAEDGSVAAVANGEKISEYQVLQGMLLPSANNLADSLATWAFGSLSAYSNYANQMLIGLNLVHTHVGDDASGFSPTTTSNAGDLVRLGDLALQNQALAGIVSQSTATIPVAGQIKNVNWLLGTSGIDGIKTGNSNQDAGALLFSADYQVPGGPRVRFIGAVLKGSSLQQAMDSAVPLLTSSEKALSFTATMPAGQAVGQYKVPWGSPVTAVTAKSINALVWQNQVLAQPVVSLSGLTAPQTDRAKVGTASYKLDTQTLSTSPVTLAHPIAKPSLWWRITHD